MADNFIDVIDFVPDNVFKTHKKIFNHETQEFESHTYYGARRKSYPDAVKWLKENYAVSRSPISLWWETMDFVVMDEKIFMFYLLSRK